MLGLGVRESECEAFESGVPVSHSASVNDLSEGRKGDLSTTVAFHPVTVSDTEKVIAKCLNN